MRQGPYESMGKGYTKCPRCGTMSVKKTKFNNVICYYDMSCGWRESDSDGTDSPNDTKDPNEGLSSYDFFLKVMRG